MIHIGLLNVIRRMALREKLPIREIARRTGLSRNTIKKCLNAGTIEPKFVVPERPSKLDPYADKLAAWLKTETAKSRKQRRPLTHLHASRAFLVRAYLLQTHEMLFDAHWHGFCMLGGVPERGIYDSEA